MSDRPRRSIRQPPRYQDDAPTPATAVVSRAKRKAQHADPADQLRFLLQSPKSALTTTHISVRRPSLWSHNCDLLLQTLFGQTSRSIDFVSLGSHKR